MPSRSPVTQHSHSRILVLFRRRGFSFNLNGGVRSRTLLQIRRAGERGCSDVDSCGWWGPRGRSIRRALRHLAQRQRHSCRLGLHLPNWRPQGLTMNLIAEGFLLRHSPGRSGSLRGRGLSRLLRSFAKCITGMVLSEGSGALCRL